MALKTAHAGHGGVDPGSLGNGYTEAAVARLYCNDLVKLTGAVNCTDDTAVSVNDNLAKIVNKVNANAVDNDWNVSIHLNAFKDPSATGVEVFAFGGDAAGMAKAAEISAKLASIYGLVNRGAKDGSGLYVIRNTKGHTLLIELGFISNSNDIKQIIEKRPQAVKAIAECFGYSGGTITPNPAPVPTTKAPTPAKPTPGKYIREYNETGTMEAFEPNWIKRTPTKAAPILEWQSTGQKIKYHKVLWNDGIVWLQINYGGGGQAYVAYADANGTGFGRKYGKCY